MTGFRRTVTQAGFTLVELLVVVAVFGILTTIATPSFSEFGRNQRIRATGFDLVGDLQLARSEAIKRASEVTIASADGGWAGGWTVTVDTGPAAGSLVRQRAAAATGIDVVDAPDSLTFDRSGRLAGGGIARLGIADKVASVVKRCIVVELSGMARSLSGDCS
jgi:type IV fimbrial biogenesis protein FimT